MKIITFWPDMQMLANVLYQRSVLENGGKAASLRAEAESLLEAVKERRADERADQIAREVRNAQQRTK